MLGELDPPLGFEEIEPLTRATLTFGQSLKGSELVEAEMAIGRAASLLECVSEHRNRLGGVGCDCVIRYEGELETDRHAESPFC